MDDTIPGKLLRAGNEAIMARYVLGLDMGETSIGWAMVGLSETGEPIKAMDAGVRVFPAGAQVDERKGTTETDNQERRGHRSGRRRS